MLEPQSGSSGVKGTVSLATFQRGRKGAADEAQCRGEHQQHDQGTGHYGISRNVAESLNQPGRGNRLGDPGQQSHPYGENPHHYETNGQ